MYKLIIADDEKRIRLGLKNVVDWEELGFEVTELFTDGQEIIEYLDYVMPDVILTDIKMNHVSGLDVAKYVFENKFPCRVVLVSGYQEFELALQGIKFGAEDYLLKPVDVGSFIKTFQKVKGQLDEARVKQEAAQAQKDRMEEAIPLLEERFFTDLVMGVSDSEEYIRSCFGILYPGLDVEASSCILVDIYIEDYEQFMQKVWEYSYDQFEMNLANFLRIYQRGYCFHIVYKAENLIELMGIRIDGYGENRGLEGQNAVEQLLKELEQSFRFRSRYRMCQTYDSILDIGRQKEENWNRQEDMAVLDQHLQEQKKLVMSNISLGNIVTAQKLFHSILEEVKPLSSVVRNNIIIDILSTMNAVILEVNGKLSQSLQNYFNYTAVLSMGKAEEIETYCDRIFDRIKLADEKKEYYDTGTLITKARNYIKENIYKDISQEETANQLFICPSYLSRMFRKQTGESFIQYVTRVKMEKAIELLKDTKYKTYQVSEMLGYKTPRYFSRLFRMHTGMNPREYRGKVLHIGGEYDEN